MQKPAPLPSKSKLQPKIPQPILMQSSGLVPWMPCFARIPRSVPLPGLSNRQCYKEITGNGRGPGGWVFSRVGGSRL